MVGGSEDDLADPSWFASLDRECTIDVFIFVMFVNEQFKGFVCEYMRIYWLGGESKGMVSLLWLRALFILKWRSSCTLVHRDMRMQNKCSYPFV